MGSLRVTPARANSALRAEDPCSAREMLCEIRGGSLDAACKSQKQLFDEMKRLRLALESGTAACLGTRVLICQVSAVGSAVGQGGRCA